MDPVADPRPDVPLVSVVIPVHNAEHYLAQCLDSVLAQKLTEIEVIAVDDASSDTSPDVLSRYVAADARVRVITQARNRGVSAARNAGIDAARGAFLAFVDADDLVDPTMLDDLHRAAVDLGVEVLACGIKVVDADGRVLEVVDFPLEPGLRHEPDAVREALHSAFAAKMLWYPVRSLYARRLIAEHGLRFDEGIRKGEDSLFNLQALYFARGVACVRSAPYHYRKHPGSATARPLASESANIERMGQQVIAFYRRHGFDSRADADFYAQVLRSDLPTALTRLRGQTSLPSEIRELLATSTVQTALDHEDIARLSVPLRVAAILWLCKRHWIRPVSLALKASEQRWPQRKSRPSRGEEGRSGNAGIK